MAFQPRGDWILYLLSQAPALQAWGTDLPVKKSHQLIYSLTAFAAGCLIAWLSTGEPAARQPAQAPKEPNSGAIETLEGALGETSPNELVSLVEAVGKDESAGARSSGASLLERAYTSSEDAQVHAAVLAALERLGGPRACAALASIFRLGNQDAAQAAMRLSRIADQDCASELRSIIEKEKRRGELARSALRALGRTRSRSAAEFCAELCSTTYEPAVRREAAEALGRIAERASVTTLLGLLGDQDGRIRKAAITALGLIRSDESERGLRAHGEAPGLGAVEARLVEEALGRLGGREPSRLR